MHRLPTNYEILRAPIESEYIGHEYLALWSLFIRHSSGGNRGYLAQLQEAYSMLIIRFRFFYIS